MGGTHYQKFAWKNSSSCVPHLPSAVLIYGGPQTPSLAPARLVSSGKSDRAYFLGAPQPDLWVSEGVFPRVGFLCAPSLLYGLCDVALGISSVTGKDELPPVWPQTLET